MAKKWIKHLVLFFLLGAILLPLQYSSAQTSDQRRPIDMMIVIDNSCSMFPANQILANCTASGNDPDFLRIIGADLFLARLGFGDPNEAEYQAGIVNFGEEPVLVSPLQPLAGIRDELAAKIANPVAQSSTLMLPGMRMALEELKNSPNRRENNMPAVVLITDGAPYPKEGQSTTDFEALLNQYPTSSLFLIILQTSSDTSEDFKNYIEFWKGLSTRNPRIFVYPISDANQIEETYNTIVAQLQNTIPGKGLSVTPSQSVSFYASEYLQKVIVTVIRRTLNQQGTVTIRDPQGNAVSNTDDGVSYFRGEENPIEVISITAPRLSPELKKADWTITSDTDVTILVDREGSYNFNFIEPVAGPSDVTNLFIASEPVNPNREVVIRFSLSDQAGNPVTDPQTIVVEVTLPDGRVKPLSGLNVVLSGDGIYEMRFSPISVYPDVVNKPGRFIFNFKAGQADANSAEPIPVTTSRLIVDMGRTPTIRSINPQPVVCSAGWQTDLRVTLEDTDVAQAESLKVKVLGLNNEIALTTKDTLTYRGDLSAICQVALSQLSCSETRVIPLTVQLTGLMQDGSQLPVLERDVQAEINTPECTATPVPTNTPQPTPTPTVVPDTDGDGFNDLDDKCVAFYGENDLGGCPSLVYPLSTLGGGIFLLVMFLGVLPWARVHTYGKPPAGFVQVIRAGKPVSQPISVEEIGVKKRATKVTIGSARKATINVEGLQPLEYSIEHSGPNVAMREMSEKEPFAFFDCVPRLIHTSDPKVVLKIGLDRSTF